MNLFTFRPTAISLINVVVLITVSSFSNLCAQAFTDESVSAGLDFSHDGNLHPDEINEFGTGAAWFDYNNDGNLDLYVTMRTQANKLFHNNGDGTFTDVAATVGLQDAANDGAGVAVADYDNDGWQDIYLANGEKDKFFKNVGGTFIDFTIDAGFDWNEASRGTSPSWGDYDGDGFLDLYVAHHEPVEGVNNSSYQDRLYHNNGDGTFTEVSDILADAGIITGLGFIGGWTDFDRDGDLDIFLVNDCLSFNLIPIKIFRNDGDTHPTLSWNFTEVSVDIGVDDCSSGMGIAVGDYNRDGWMDVFYTDVGEVNLWRNDGGTFSRETTSAQLGGQGVHDYSWGSFFFDYDLDGWQDLYFVSGTLHGSSDVTPMSNYLFRNNGNGTNFTDTSDEMNMGDVTRGRTTVFGDYDNDGDPDVFTVNYGEPVSLKRNNNDNGNHYLKIHLVGTVSNLDGIGSYIKLDTPDGQTQYFETRSGSSLGGGCAVDAYFGLGSNTSILSVEITWPSGIIQTLSNVGIDQYTTIQEPYEPCVIINFDPPVVESAEICSNEPIPTFTASVESGLVVDWYDAPSGGNLLLENSMTYTPENGGTFYALAKEPVEGCLSDATEVTLTIFDAPVVDAGLDQSSCMGGSINFIITVTGGDENYNYQWIDNLSDGPILQFTPTETATYGVTVTDGNGCSSADEVMGIINELPTVSAGEDVTICEQECFTFEPIVFGGVAPYLYNWSGDNDTMACPIDTTVYTLVVTDENGCQGEDNLQINVSPLPVADAGQDQNLCLGDCYVLEPNATGGITPYSFNWNTTQDTICPTDSTAYFLTVTDVNNCSTIDTINVNVNIPSDTIYLDTLLCEGVCITYNASTLGLSSFMDNDTFIQTTILCEAGIFEVPALDENGCATSVTFTIQMQSAPAVNAGADQVLTCTQIEVNIGQEAVPGINYQWSNGPDTSSQVVTVPGLYILTASNDLPECSTSDTVEIAIDTLSPIASAGEDLQLTCADPVVIPDGSLSSQGDNITYLWSSNDGNITTGENTLQPEIETAGTYLLSVTNIENGCSASDLVVVAIAEEPALFIDEVVNVLCEGEATGSISVSGSGGAPGYTYLWSNGADTSTVNDLPAGEYSVTLTDQNSCEVILAFDVTSPSALIPELSATAETANGAQDGSISATVIGGTPDYTYEWSTGSTESSITGLTPQEYFLTVTDANGCMAVDSAKVNSFACESMDVSVIEDSFICPGSDSGSLEIAAISGGTEPYDILWSTNSNESGISNLTAGHYSSTITDAQNCEIILQFEITEGDSIPPTLLSQDITLYLDENGSASFTPEMMDGGSFDNCSDITFLNEAMDVSCANLGAFGQLAIISDDSGLLDSSFVMITVLDTLKPIFISCPENIVSMNCDAVVYELPAAVDNCQVVSMELTEGFSSGETFPEGTTTVNYSASDNSDNSTNCSFTITVENTLEATAQTSDFSCDPDNPFTAILTANGGIPDYTYQWNDGTTNAENNLTAPGPWAWTITDSQGCEQTGTINAEIPDTISITLQSTAESGTAGNGSIDATIVGGTSPLLLEWQDEMGNPLSTEEDLIDLSTGLYCLTATDANGCETTACIEVDQINSTMDEEFYSAIQISPNPTSGNLRVSFNLPQNETAVLILMDINGKILSRTEKRLEVKKINMEMSAYSDGVYLLKIVVGDRIAVKKVLVSK